MCVCVWSRVIKRRFVCIHVESVKRNEHNNKHTHTTRKKTELISFVHLANNKPSSTEKEKKKQQENENKADKSVVFKSQ